jgi:hypothetical protein
MIHTTANAKEGPLTASLSARSGKIASDKPERSKKSSKPTSPAIASGVGEQEGFMASPHGDVRSRIAERAYELYHRRGGHHGQDLGDWFAAEQEIQQEQSL